MQTIVVAQQQRIAQPARTKFSTTRATSSSRAEMQSLVSVERSRINQLEAEVAALRRERLVPLPRVLFDADNLKLRICQDERYTLMISHLNSATVWKTHSHRRSCGLHIGGIHIKLERCGKELDLKIYGAPAPIVHTVLSCYTVDIVLDSLEMELGNLAQSFKTTALDEFLRNARALLKP